MLLGPRDAGRGKRACEQAGPNAELVELDLTDLDSVRRAAADVRLRTGDALHVLMNNAGVMGTPPGMTVDGFETQIGTNHLGHAALTWLLMPALRAAGGARVVTLSSLAHRGGGLDLDDLSFLHRAYVPGRAYSQSKLANLLFAAELDRRLRARGDDVISVAAHPGLTDTELLENSMRQRGAWLAPVARVVNALTTQPVRRGVLPQLCAATAPQVGGGTTSAPGPRPRPVAPPVPPGAAPRAGRRARPPAVGRDGPRHGCRTRSR
ncbi:MAG: hypothetical protein QOG20_2771 [Pseudonocardiales bacterium]|nr:hypothetical protein [Pseudonocardiales bacterium]